MLQSQSTQYNISVKINKARDFGCIFLIHKSRKLYFIYILLTKPEKTRILVQSFCNVIISVHRSKHQKVQKLYFTPSHTVSWQVFKIQLYFLIAIWTS